MDKCSYCGSIDMRGSGLCGECYAEHFNNNCEARPEACEACAIIANL